MRSPQQKTGDRLESDALAQARERFPDADLTRGSGNVNHDGDVVGVPELHVECKNSEVLGKGRSISKKDWLKTKEQAQRRCLTPAHLGYDDGGEIVALVPWRDLLAFVDASYGRPPCSDS